MKLLEIKRENINLFLIKFETKSIFSNTKTYERHIFLDFGDYYNYADNGNFIGFDLNRTVCKLANQLNGHEPLIIK